MKRRIAIILALAVAIIGAVIYTTAAYAGHQWIMLHHVDQGQGQQSFDQCMPLESWSGHDGHVGDWYEGPFDNDDCDEEEATDEPEDTPEPTETEEPEDDPTATPDPTDAPEPTPTDVSEEPTSEPTPDSEDCEIDCEPTTTPPVTEEPEQLPSAGYISQYDVMNGEPWVVFMPDADTVVWAAHNQEGWIASTWWQLWVNVEFYWPYGDSPSWYTVTNYIIADVTNVSLIYATEPDVILVTCRGYSAETNTWAQRLVIYANLSN